MPALSPASFIVTSGRPRRKPSGTGSRGSVLIVALMICALIALTLGSYLSLNLNSTRQAKRAFHNSAALNLAEAGAEEAVWSFNRATAGHDNAWTGWSDDGTAAWRKFTGFDFAANTTGSVKVYATTTNPPPGATPKIIALASVNPPEGNPVTRMIEVTLRRRSYFSAGLVAKESLIFNGNNTTVDSWDSDPDGDPATPAIPYDPAVRRDGGSIASVSVLNTAMLINQADIWGYVYTGGAQPQVGSHGSIRGANTAPDILIDPSRIATDFNAEFPTVAAPTDGTYITTVGHTLGTPGLVTSWRCPAISLNGNKTLTIRGHVTLVLTAGPGVPALEVTGNAAILIPDGSSLTLYAEGDIKIAGNGLGNANAQPISCLIWGTGTAPGAQALQIAGNGALKTVVYAPNAILKINGNGDVMGSMIAQEITLVGNAAFHYDEALSRREHNTPYGITKWREISTAAGRAGYEDLFRGW